MFGIFKTKNLINFLYIFILFYLVYHTLHGKYNLQNYLIYEFEERMYQDFHYNLNKKIIAINMDLHALRENKKDFIDEINKRINPKPRQGEIVIKLD